MLFDLLRVLTVFSLAVYASAELPERTIVNLDTIENRTIYASSDNSVTLRCHHANTETAQWWYRSTRQTSATQFASDEYTIAPNDSSSLDIHSFVRGYSYKCQLSDKTGAIVFRSGWIKIDAGKRPQIDGLPLVVPFAASPKQTTIMVKLNYSVAAVPPASVEWECKPSGNSSRRAFLRNGKLIVNATRVTKSMWCRLWAWNAMGNASKIIRLVVDEHPVMKCLRRDNSIPCGGEGELFCYVESDLEDANVTVLHVDSETIVQSSVEFDSSNYSIRVSFKNASPCAMGRYLVKFTDSLGRKAKQEIFLNVNRCKFLGFRSFTHTHVEISVRNYACAYRHLFQSVTIEDPNRKKMNVVMTNELTSYVNVPLPNFFTDLKIRGTAATTVGEMLADELHLPSCSNWYDDATSTGYYPSNNSYEDYYQYESGDCYPNVTVLDIGLSDNGECWIEFSLDFSGCSDPFLLEYWSDDDFGSVSLSPSKNTTVISGLTSGDMYNFNLKQIRVNKSRGGMPEVEMRAKNAVNMEVKASPMTKPASPKTPTIDKDRLIISTIILAVLFGLSGIIAIYVCCYLYISRKRKIGETEIVQTAVTNRLARTSSCVTEESKETKL